MPRRCYVPHEKELRLRIVDHARPKLCPRVSVRQWQCCAHVGPSLKICSFVTLHGMPRPFSGGSGGRGGSGGVSGCGGMCVRVCVCVCGGGAGYSISSCMYMMYIF